MPVVPAYIWGTPPSDEVVASLRTRSEAHVVFGRPIGWAEIAAECPDALGEGAIDKATLNALSQRLMRAIDALRDRFNPEPPDGVG